MRHIIKDVKIIAFCITDVFIILKPLNQLSVVSTILSKKLLEYYYYACKGHSLGSVSVSQYTTSNLQSTAKSTC